jgi:hypothetical protein
MTGLERHRSAARRSAGACRACGGHGLELVLDLGAQPPAERLVRPEEADRPDAVFPLRILLCPTCFLVQLDGEPIESDSEPGGLAFSVSPTMRAHIRGFVDDALRRTNSTAHLRVVEMASHANRLHELLAATGVASMLIEPVPRYAAAARAAGEPTTNDRLTEKVAAEIVRAGGQADLVIDAFYLAHDASPPDYAAGIRRLLAPGGVAAIEFDHVLPVIEEGQYDGFRHGHASYLSLHALARLFERFGLTVVEALRTPAYGGSLRIYVRRAEEAARADETVGDVLAAEALAGLTGIETYRAFARRVDQARSALREFLDECRRDGRTVAAYGAPSRGNTLLNSTAVRDSDILFAADRSPDKQGSFLPGSRIPIVGPDHVAAVRPDYLLILTWDLRDEIVHQMGHIREWGGRFVVPLPELSVLP